MTVRSWACFISVGAAICLVACESGTPAATAPPSPPDIHLVSAGSEPRRLLRYRPAIGTKQRLQVRTDAEVDAGGMGGPMPTIILAMTVSVDALFPTGQMKIRATFDEATAIDHPKSAVPAAAIAGALEKLEGLAVDAMLSPNGRLAGAKLDLGRSPVPMETNTQIASLVSSFEQTMMPLPDEPVGVGAVWRSSRPLEYNGLKLETVNSITITAMTGDSITYSLETDIHGDDQTVAQGAVSIAVKDIIGAGGGTGTIDLVKLALTSELVAELRTVMTTAGETDETKMSMATISKVRPL